MDGLVRAGLFIRVALSQESRRDLRSLRLNDLSVFVAGEKELNLSDAGLGEWRNGKRSCYCQAVKAIGIPVSVRKRQFLGSFTKVSGAVYVI